MPDIGDWAVPADQKWTDMFDGFINEQLGVSHIGDDQTECVWEALSAAMCKIRLAHGNLK